MIFKLCVAITNFHIQQNPLRATDHNFYESLRSRLYSIGQESNRKRKRAQQNYRERKKRCTAS